MEAVHSIATGLPIERLPVKLKWRNSQAGTFVYRNFNRPSSAIVCEPPIVFSMRVPVGGKVM